MKRECIANFYFILPNEILLDAFSGAKIISNIGHDETGDFH